MPVHVIWKGACLNWSLLSVWIQGEAHPHSTFHLLVSEYKGHWALESRKKSAEDTITKFTTKAGRCGFSFVSSRGQTNFSAEQGTNHQLHFYFYGEGEWNYDGNLVGAGDDAALCTCAFSR